jgi:hypothetical protein
MQLHRQHQYELRDKFLMASLGHDTHFWKRGDLQQTIEQRMRKYDPVPICWLLLVNSVPSLRGRIRLPDGLTLSHLARSRGNAKPQAIRAAVDEIRKEARETASAD